MYRFHILLLYILLFISFSFSQENVYIEVESGVDTSVITIGDRINYSIVIKRDKELNVVRPGAGVNLGMFEIKGYDFPEPIEKDGIVTERFDFEIAVFDTGKFTIPPFPVAYFEKDTSAYQIIEASAIDIFVASLLSGDDAPELKDIKPPIDFPFNYLFWISLFGIIILLAVLVFFGYRFWNQRRERGYLFKPPPPPQPAHVVAFNSLNELFKSDLLSLNKYKEFFSELSEIIRTYLEGRYFILAMEETTYEILNDLKNHMDDGELSRSLSELLSLSDMIKFAKYIPVDEEVETSKNDAWNFVDQTKLEFVKEQPTEPGEADSDPISENQTNTIQNT